jgi:hypothetical protein
VFTIPSKKVVAAIPGGKVEAALKTELSAIFDRFRAQLRPVCLDIPMFRTNVTLMILFLEQILPKVSFSESSCRGDRVDETQRHIRLCESYWRLSWTSLQNCRRLF